MHDESGAIRAARQAVALTGPTGTAKTAKKARIERLVLLGQALAQAKQDSEARDVFGQALKLDPGLHGSARCRSH